MATTLMIMGHSGSADFTLGKWIAGACRKGMVIDCQAQTGVFLVVDGTLSDEVEDTQLGRAIDAALEAAAIYGQASARVFACDDQTPDWPSVLVAKVTGTNVPKDARITVIKCWLDGDGDDGCINVTYDALTAPSFARVDYSGQAVKIQY